MTNKRARIRLEGWRPWSNNQLSGIGIRLLDEMPDELFLKHLRLALDALYYHEVKKYNDFKGIEEDTSSCQSTLIAAEIPAVDTNSKPILPEATQPESSTPSPAPSADES